MNKIQMQAMDADNGLSHANNHPMPSTAIAVFS
jgi:hypothetical protein